MLVLQIRQFTIHEKKEIHFHLLSHLTILQNWSCFDMPIKGEGVTKFNFFMWQNKEKYFFLTIHEKNKYIFIYRAI